MKSYLWIFLFILVRLDLFAKIWMTQLTQYLLTKVTHIKKAISWIESGAIRCRNVEKKSEFKFIEEILRKENVKVRI